MRYLDTGSRDPAHALGTWLQNCLQPDVVEIRCQSGFFSADSLGLLLPALARLHGSDDTARFVVGSNDGGTAREDVRQLMAVLGVPRPGARLVVVQFGGGAYFHPKAYHFRRADGSQCAYVGSANLSASGVASLHVEAGVALDTRDGDAAEVLEEVARSVDAWCTPGRPGTYPVEEEAHLDPLVEAGILAAVRPPPARGAGSGRGTGGSARARLSPLIALPPVNPSGAPPTGQDASTPGVRPPLRPASRTRLPAYLHLAPGATAPTTGRDALSGEPLPDDAVGLVIQLTKDNARWFAGKGVGTCNFTIPSRTAHTLRFGWFKGRKHEGPRAEYRLRMRYLAEPETVLGVPTETTGVMPYGHREGEKGHRDLRLVIPAAVRSLASRIKALALPVPAVGDPALLEWPTPEAPEFRISYLQRGSALFETAEAMLRSAAAARRLVGRSTCWLPEGVSPTWL